MSIIVQGDTDGERKLFVRGYIMAAMDAARLVAAMATDAGEKAGEAPVGSLTDVKNKVAALAPRGSIVATYTVE